MSAALCRKCGTPDCGHKRGGYSRAMALTADHQRLARSHVKRESLQRAGSLGFKGLVENGSRRPLDGDQSGPEHERHGEDHA